MYESFFSLEKKPFELLPNPDFLYMSRSHQRALTYLDYGIRERAGFILLTGEIGSGKTTIVRDLIKKQDGRMVISKVFNTIVDASQLLAMINDDFGIPVGTREKTALLRDLHNFLIGQYAKGKQPILIIDEAQNLSPELLEEIRMLSNLETDSARLLQIILVGQPELRKVLALPELKQLRQRISIVCQLQPLSPPETEGYILHRLGIAGNRDAVTFTVDALQIICRYSRGIPRLINIICDFFMLSAFAEKTREINGDMVRDIVGDLNFELTYWGDELARVPESTVPAGGFNDDSSAAFRELCLRLGRIESGFSEQNPHAIEQLKEQLSSVESALMFHDKETVATVRELSRKVEQAIKDQGTLPLPVQEEKAAKGGLVRRIFGR